jgi:hypothetical protein
LLNVYHCEKQFSTKTLEKNETLLPVTRFPLFLADLGMIKQEGFLFDGITITREPMD